MPTTDPVFMVYQPRYKKLSLEQGGKVFYGRCPDAENPLHWQTAYWSSNHRDELLLFGSEQKAKQWVKDNLGMEIGVPEDKPLIQKKLL